MTSKNLIVKPVNELVIALDVLEKKYNPSAIPLNNETKTASPKIN